MGFREAFIELQRFARGRARLAYGFIRRSEIVGSHHAVAIGQTGVRAGVPRIVGYGLLEMEHGPLQICRPALGPVEASAEIVLVGFRVNGLRHGEALPGRRRETELDVLRDVARDLVLEVEDVPVIALVAPGPDVAV